MIQITAMNAAKPLPSGMEALAGMSGEGQDSSGFEGVLTTQLESVAIPVTTAGDALMQATGKTGGKAAGKAGGKILPVGLPDSRELSSGEGEAVLSIGLPVPSVQAAGRKEETAAGTLPQPSPDQIPLVMAPLLAVAQPATEMAAASSGDNQPHAASRASLPQAMVTSSSRLPAASLPQLPTGSTVEVPVATGQEAKAVQPGFPTALPTLPGSVPVYLDQATGEAGQLPQPAALAALPTGLVLPVRAVAVSPLALSGEPIRLRPVVSNAGQAGAETPAAPTVDTASILPASVAKEAFTAPVAQVVPAAPAAKEVSVAPAAKEVSTVSAAVAAPVAPVAEVVSTASASTKQAARIAGISTKESLDTPQQLPRFAEVRQDASGWFGPSAHARPDAATPASQLAPGHAAERPHDFAALVDRLVAAREFAMPTPVYAAIAHAEFGEVSLKFEHGDHGLAVAVSSPDPDFARAVQAAAPSDRQAATHDNRDSGAAGNSAAYRQDMHSQSDGGAQAQSRNAGSSDRQGSDVRQLRREDTASSQTEKSKPRRDGIFA